MQKVVLGSIVVLGLLAAPAMGADMPVKAPAAAPLAAYNWTGFYVGGDVGGRWLQDNANISSASIGTPPVNTLGGAGPGNSLNNSAFRGGLFAGWNWQSRQWVWGVEADVGWANKTSSLIGSPYPSNLLLGTPTFPGPFLLGGNPSDSFSVKTSWDSSVRLRGGFLISPSVLIFATGGPAWLQLSETSNCSTAPNGATANCAPGNYFNGTLGPAAISHSQTRTGWTIGGGVESMLGQNWLIRAEYRYADFGTFNVNDVRTCTGGCIVSEGSPLSISYAMRVTTQTAMVGVAYKFGN
jgi:outer membrane immunogenic protein